MLKILYGVVIVSLFHAVLAHAGSERKTLPFVEIYSDDALSIIDAHAQFSVLGKGYAWSEGPLWIAQENILVFSDVPKNTLYQYKKDEGVSVYLSPSGATQLFDYDSSQGGNGLLLNAEGELVIMQHGDRRIAIMDAPLDAPQAKFVTLTDSYENKRLNSPNDGIYHSNGDLYFTDPPYGLDNGDRNPHKELSFSGVYRLSEEGALSLEDDSLTFPNGIVLSNDETKAFVAVSDPSAAKWYRYNVLEDGRLENREVFYDATHLVGQVNENGLPDGMAIHSKGYLFATGPGGVFVFTETGKLLAKIRTGKATANCTLSTDEKTLYMTAHDTLMSIALK